MTTNDIIGLKEIAGPIYEEVNLNTIYAPIGTGGTTSLTLTALNALISGSYLVIGQQYYVTDKGWLLFAKAVNKLGSFEGLKIMNGDTLPAGIEPNVLFIDTGMITDDLSINTGTPLPIIVPSNYYPISPILDVIANSEVISTITVFQFFMLDGFDLQPGHKYVIPDLGNNSSHDFSSSFDNTIQAEGNGDGNTCKLIIEFHRSQF
jgi:hypothetical protein